jgi:hypothetical protein
VICYQGKLETNSEVNVHDFVDVDWANDLDQRRLDSGYVFILFDGAISWMSKRQTVVSFSTTEVKIHGNHLCQQRSSVVA